MMHEALVFDDLAVAGSLADARTTRYRYRIKPPLNDPGEDGGWQETTMRAVPLGLFPAAESPPPSRAQGSTVPVPTQYEVTIETNRGDEDFGPAIRIQLERDGRHTRIIAIRR
jgi:hypothetical protein